MADITGKLTSDRQEISLMSFFIGLNEREIGEIVGKNFWSIWYQHQAAIEDLGKLTGGNCEGNKRYISIIPIATI